MQKVLSEKWIKCIDFNPGMVIITDTEGILKGLNKATCSFLNCVAKEVLGKNFLEFLDPTDEERGVKEFKIFLKTKIPKPIIVKVILLSGETKILKVTANYVNGYIFHSLEDVTELKKVEEDLKSNKELLKLLLSMIRHDLTNILAVEKSGFNLIKKSLEILRQFLESLQEKPPEIIFEELEKIEELVAEMDQKTSAGVHLINRTRDLESIGASKSNLSPYNCRKIIEAVVGNFSKNTIFNISGQGRILVDESFFSVINNIIENGVKHGNATEVSITIEEGKENVKINLFNNGEQIDEKKIKNLLDFDNEEIDPQAVHGVGLHIVKSNILRYGGDIKIENKEDGVLYTIVLQKI